MQPVEPAPVPVPEVPLSSFERNQRAKQQEATRMTAAARTPDTVRDRFLSGITGTKFMTGENPKFRK